ncbi:hypothetical protein CRG98_009532 [Punica granatum]|uniref:Uncharacterized protein n=1 Tax=Punica granatum TaxID=22663 RepID=A0A2I0KNQ6_PUNGR|nr:hypothetical protein CRG98_009532 [Punica granatum]
MASGDSFSRASVARPWEGGHSQAALHRRAHACPDETKFGCAQYGKMNRERERGNESHHGKGPGALKLGPVALPQLLHLVLALHGCLGRGRSRAAMGHGVDDLLPVGGLEVATAEQVPLVSIGIDQRQQGGGRSRVFAEEG